MGDPEEPAVKPGAPGSGAGFLEPGRAGPAPGRHPPPVTWSGCSRQRPERRASSPPAHARRCPPSQGKSPPRFARRSRPARTYLGPPGPAEGSRGEPLSGQSFGRGYRALTRRERLQNGLAEPTGPAPKPSFRRHLGPPPPPSRAFVPPPGARLSPGEGGRG
ncbi:basic salivary proline-rich protein 2-like isoform X2 [Moschus berezovskii]|uniref:basic salivary proline-rich protein 2-like isoform X2 n=1 Tax=Moschus berezovskii TaxID=68408 RepID=UPI002443E08B|nr:basic salivary proline-rich protein 2-like isoform X2 [Moschus berezovskii]